MTSVPPHWLRGLPPARLLEKICKEKHLFYQEKYGGSTVGLGILRIGDDPASLIYVQRKRAMAEKLGFTFYEKVFVTDTDPQEIFHTIEQWNHTPNIHGMIFQLPIPQPHISKTYLQAIAVHKDVDGIHPTQKSPFTPCTPLGCMALLKYYAISLKGKNSVIIGRSHLVGLPLAHLLLQKNSTITIAHRYTKNLPELTQKADIICVCAGQPHLLTSKHISPHAIILDIGINRRDQKIVGDVHPDAAHKACAITPVPGGIGPMTVRSLMWNTLKAAFYQKGEPWEDEELFSLMLHHNDPIS